MPLMDNGEREAVPHTHREAVPHPGRGGSREAVPHLEGGEQGGIVALRQYYT
jgi:hypothetical protein